MKGRSGKRARLWALLALFVQLLAEQGVGRPVPVPEPTSGKAGHKLWSRGGGSCWCLVARLRGGMGSIDQTPPLIAADGFDAWNDDETEELMVESPGNEVLLHTTPGDRRAAISGPHARGLSAEERLPAAPLRAPTAQHVGGGMAGSRIRVSVLGPSQHSARASFSALPGTPMPLAQRCAAQEPRMQQQSAVDAVASEERIQSIELALSDRTGDWSQRVRALKDLQQIMKTLSTVGSADPCGSSGVLGSLLQRILPGLCVQLQDKRSSLVKEVCSAINSMSEMLGEDFEPAAPKLVSALFSLTFVTVRVISVAAVECLHAICARIRPPTLLTELAKGLADVHMPMRQCAVSLLAEMMALRSAEELSPHVSSLVDMVIKALNDPGVGVRSKGKDAFTHMSTKFPTHAHRMLMRVTGAMRSQLSKQLGHEPPAPSSAEAGGSIMGARSRIFAGGGESAGAASVRSKLVELRAYRRRQLFEQPGGNDDIVVMSPASAQHIGTEEARPAASRDLFSGPALRVAVDHTAADRDVPRGSCADEPRRRARKPPADSQPAGAPTVGRVRFCDDVRVVHNDDDKIATNAGVRLHDHIAYASCC
jgi:hypothetical protein